MYSGDGEINDVETGDKALDAKAADDEIPAAKTVDEEVIDADGTQEQPGTLWGWLKGSSLTVKILIVSSIVIISGNVLLILYISATINGSFSVPGRTYKDPVSSQPANAKPPMSELEYEKHFVDYYEKSALTGQRLQRLIDGTMTQDGDWHRELSVQITLLKTLVNNAQEIIPPTGPGYKEVHGSYLKAFAEFGWAADNLMMAITENDKALQDRCLKRLIKGRELMDQAVQKLKGVYGSN